MATYDIRAPGARRPLDHVEFGPGLGADIDRRLLGDIEGRNVLVLGSGAGHDAVGLTKRGALVTTVDRDADQLACGRDLAMAEEVAVGFHRAELADLAFIQADQMDIVISIHALSFVEDLDRVFRQVHRVLKHGARFVISVPPKQYMPAYVFFADPSYPETNLVIVRAPVDDVFQDVTLDCAGVADRRQSLSKYGTKLPKS